MQSTRLDESRVEIKIAGWNISNLTYAGDSTLMAESKEDINSLLIRVKEESEKVGLKILRKLRSWHLVSSFHDRQKGKKLK